MCYKRTHKHKPTKIIIKVMKKIQKKKRNKVLEAPDKSWSNKKKRIRSMGMFLFNSFLIVCLLSSGANCFSKCISIIYLNISSNLYSNLYDLHNIKRFQRTYFLLFFVRHFVSAGAYLTSFFFFLPQ